MSGVQGLIRHLQQNPQARSESAEALAAQFSVDAGLVRSVLSSVASQPVATAVTKGPVTPTIFSRLGDAVRARPIFWLVVTAILTAITSEAATYLLEGRSPDGREEMWVAAAIFLVFFLGTLVSGVICLLSGVVKHAGAAVGLAFILTATRFGLGALDEPKRLPYVLLGAAFLSIMTAVVTVPSAVLGGWLAMRSEQNRRRAMSRQELLERLFEVRRRLDEVGTGTQLAKDQSSFLAWGRRHAIWLAFLFSFATSLASVILIAVLDPTGITLSRPQATPPLIAVISVLVSLLGLVTVFFTGYLALRFPRALLSTLVGIVGAFIPSMLPIPPFGLQMIAKTPIMTMLVYDSFLMLIGLAGAAAAQVQEYAISRRQLSDNDPAALTAELIELEWKLRPTEAQVTVMVVDVVQSTLMKRDADPFEAEWSFREFQGLVAHVAETHLGRVHSTAGDGAVLGFAEISQALAAAEQTHWDVTHFNATRNRLTMPFILRIGIHVGTVTGDLDQVQFSRVIDVAAHAEKLAPRGRTVVTHAVADSYPGGSFTPLGQTVDGFELLVVGPLAGATSPSPEGS